MDEQRAQQSMPPAPSSPGGSFPPPAPGPYATAPAPTMELPPPQRGVFRRMARLLARRMLYASIVVGRVIKPHIGWLLLIVALLGVIGFQAFALILPRILAAGNSDTRVELIPPAAVVETFLQGQASYNAEMMWETFSPEFQSQLTERSITKESLSAQLESQRLAGQKFRKFDYVGGVDLGSNRHMYFYAVAVDIPASGQSGTISFVFTVNGDGKIVDIS